MYDQVCVHVTYIYVYRPACRPSIGAFFVFPLFGVNELPHISWNELISKVLCNIIIVTNVISIVIGSNPQLRHRQYTYETCGAILRARYLLTPSQNVHRISMVVFSGYYTRRKEPHCLRVCHAPERRLYSSLPRRSLSTPLFEYTQKILLQEEHKLALCTFILRSMVTTSQYCCMRLVIVVLKFLVVKTFYFHVQVVARNSMHYYTYIVCFSSEIG